MPLQGLKARMAEAVPAWVFKLYNLPLSDDEKGQAIAILARMPNAALFFWGNEATSVAAVKHLLRQGAQHQPWYVIRMIGYVKSLRPRPIQCSRLTLLCSIITFANLHMRVRVAAGHDTPQLKGWPLVHSKVGADTGFVGRLRCCTLSLPGHQTTPGSVCFSFTCAFCLDVRFGRFQVTQARRLAWA